MGRAFFTVIAAIAQLERELICERVKNGLKAARARGKHIGREKKRDSELIRKLLKAGLTFRNIAAIAKCSHGSVYAEKQSLLKEIEEQKKLKEEQQKIIDDAVKNGNFFLDERKKLDSVRSQIKESESVIEVTARNVTELEVEPTPVENPAQEGPKEATIRAYSLDEMLVWLEVLLAKDKIERKLGLKKRPGRPKKGS